jgi:hypothetical protein
MTPQEEVIMRTLTSIAKSLDQLAQDINWLVNKIIDEDQEENDDGRT